MAAVVENFMVSNKLMRTGAFSGGGAWPGGILRSTYSPPPSKTFKKEIKNGEKEEGKGKR